MLIKIPYNLTGSLVISINNEILTKIHDRNRPKHVSVEGSRVHTHGFLHACVSVNVCVCVCHNDKKVPNEWQAQCVCV